jgi:hypothetical protein
MTSYKITTKHPAGYRDGTHEVTVRVNANGTRYVSGGGFGCSRDYWAKTDKAAITSLLAENGMELVACKKSK